MKAQSALTSFRRLLIPIGVGVLVASSGCATHTTANGKETSVLGGAVTVTTNSFQPPTPAAALDVDTSKLVGKGEPSGKKVSILWGLINLHDY